MLSDWSHNLISPKVVVPSYWRKVNKHCECSLCVCVDFAKKRAFVIIIMTRMQCCPKCLLLFQEQIYFHVAKSWRKWWHYCNCRFFRYAWQLFDMKNRNINIIAHKVFMVYLHVKKSPTWSRFHKCDSFWGGGVSQLGCSGCAAFFLVISSVRNGRLLSMIICPICSRAVCIPNSDTWCKDSLYDTLVKWCDCDTRPAYFNLLSSYSNWWAFCLPELVFHIKLFWCVFPAI